MGNATSSEWLWERNATGRMQPKMMHGSSATTPRRRANWLDLHETQLELRNELTGAEALRAGLLDHRSQFKVRPRQLSLKRASVRGGR